MKREAEVVVPTAVASRPDPVVASDGTTPSRRGAVQPEPVEKPVAESVPPWLNP
uniref:Uncharacterized protein n=1 Tax=Brassica campestris TaxID=3711 RepID=M4F3N7_BRACM